MRIHEYFIYFKECIKVVKINKELSAGTKATHIGVNILTKAEKKVYEP